MCSHKNSGHSKQPQTVLLPELFGSDRSGIFSLALVVLQKNGTGGLGSRFLPCDSVAGYESGDDA